jgi:hypothetical protein
MKRNKYSAAEIIPMRKYATYSIPSTLPGADI